MPEVAIPHAAISRIKKIYLICVKRRFFIGFTLLMVLLFFINRYMYINRNNGYLYTEKLNYNEFYYSDETYRIRDLYSLPNDSLELRILPAPKRSKWLIEDSKGNSYTLLDELPTLKLLKGKVNYSVTSLSDKEPVVIKLEIEYLPEDNSTYVMFCNIPMIEYPLFPIERWTKLSRAISQKEISAVKKILREEIMVEDSNTTIDKIEKIGKYLIAKLRPSEGTPSDEIKRLTPLAQYNLACSKKDHIDCADYADIFHLFANCAGVPTRKIGVAGWMDNVIISGHVFNESYIEEQEKWAFVDLTSKKLMVLNSGKEVLNTIDLLNAVNSKTFEGKTALYMNANNQLDSVAYGKVNASEEEYFKQAASFYIIKEDISNNMSFAESFKEYLGTTSHYGPFYNGTIKTDNSKHYLKLYTFQISVLLFLLWIVMLVIRLVLLVKGLFKMKPMVVAGNILSQESRAETLM